MISSTTYREPSERVFAYILSNHADQLCQEGLSPTVLTGTGVVRGAAIGIAHHYRDMLSRELEQTDIEPEQIAGEIHRIDEARCKAVEEVASLEQKVETSHGKTNAGIFAVQRMLLEDSRLISELSHEVERRMINAEAAVRDYFRRISYRLHHSDNELMRRQADDYRDIGRLMLRLLLGREDSLLKHQRKPTILISRRLLPTDTVRFAQYDIRGLVTEECGVNSHSAILARELNLPCLSGIEADRRSIPEGAPLILDSENNELIVNPTRELVRGYKRRARRNHIIMQSLVRSTRNLNLFHNDQPISVSANVSSASEVRQAVSYGMDSIGLFRLEALYLLRNRQPEEKELIRELEKSLQLCQGKTATIRLLDSGGEKCIPCLHDSDAESMLGMRGIRLLLGRPELLHQQINACLRLGARYPVQVLIPMVTTVDDVIETRKCLNERIHALKKAGIDCADNLRLGAMIETPAALFSMDTICRYVDFIAFGTNDLIQYLTAANRQNSDVAHYYNAGNQLVIDLLKRAIVCAHHAKVACSLCGELAGDLRVTSALLDAGLRSFSVAPPAIPSLKAHIHALINREQTRTARSAVGDH